MFLSESRLKKKVGGDNNTLVRATDGVYTVTGDRGSSWEISVSDGFSILVVLLFGKFLDKDCFMLALLTPVLCDAKSSIVLAFLDAVFLDFHHGKRVVLYHGDSRSSQHCARNQCRRWHVAVIAKRKRRQHGFK